MALISTCSSALYIHHDTSESDSDLRLGSAGPLCLLAAMAMQVTANGCSGGVAANAGVIGDVPSGSVTLNGSCYDSYTDTDGTTFVPMGTMTVGTCYQYQFGDMSVEDSCRPCSSFVDGCSASVTGCYSCLTACAATYTAVAGDDCYSIATAYGITLDDLLSLNPGLNCEPLSINQAMCVQMGTGACTNLCEGTFV